MFIVGVRLSGPALKLQLNFMKPHVLGLQRNEQKFLVSGIGLHIEISVRQEKLVKCFILCCDYDMV